MNLSLKFDTYLLGIELDSGEAKEEDFDTAERIYEELLERFPLLSLASNRRGEILYLYLDTSVETPLEFVKFFVDSARKYNIPGLYTVPELGLKDVPFDVVLEKVKEYYERKWKEEATANSQR